MKKGSTMSEESRSKMREAALLRWGQIPKDQRVSNFKGRKHSPGSLALMSRKQRGRKHTLTTEGRESFRRLRSGPNNHFWKGGVCDENVRIRGSTEYRHWRTAIFERDNYTCQNCGQVGGRLNADHVKRFADYPELRFELSNGRTLCENCHRKTVNFGRWRAEKDIPGWKSEDIRRLL